jgi:hypothetical protein
VWWLPWQHSDQQLNVDQEEKDKYFGDAGRKAFFALYKTMFKQRQLFAKKPKGKKKRDEGEGESDGDDIDDDEDDDDDDDASYDEAELLNKMAATEEKLSPRTK